MLAINRTTVINRKAPLNRGLLRWWLCLPKKHGGNRWQELARKSDATINGATATGTRGRTGGWGCYEYDGTDDSGQTATIDLSSISQMTLCCWLYWNAFADDNDMLFESSADSSAAARQGAISILPNFATSSSFGVRVNASGTLFNGVRFTRPSAATWHHYAFCYDRTAGAQQVVSVYVDGVSQSLTTVTTNTTSTGGFGNWAWNFMSRNNASLFGAGKLDDVRIYNRILSASEAQQLYRASRLGYKRELNRQRRVYQFEHLEDVPPDGGDTVFTIPPWRRREGGMIWLDKQELDNTDLATAGGASLTVPAGTKYMTVEAVGGAMNYEIDGAVDIPTTGATGAGSRISAGAVLPVYAGFTTFRIIRQADVATQLVNVNYYGGHV